MAGINPEHKALLEAKNYRKVFEELVNAYQEPLYWKIRKMLVFHEESEDCLQETYIKIWKALPNFRGDSALFSWAYRIATNEALMAIRKSKRLTETNAIDLANQLESDPYFDGDEAEAKFLAAIEGLPEQQKLVFKMRYFNEMKFKDIAEITGKSEGGLKANYHHAQEKLKALIQHSD